jgi:small subunit ribosomal protein S2
LTNFKTVSKSIKKLVDLKKLQASEEFSIRSKNEQLMIGKQIAKMERFIGGISTMREMPSIIIVSDLVQEKNAVMEARKMNIPVIAIANSNANPNDADFIIPANSHSVRAIYLIISVLCDAIAELNGKETMVVGKNDNEIFLPQDTKKVQSQNIINHKKFGRFANNKDSTSEEKTI